MQAPHPPLNKYYRAPEDRPEWVQSIFDRTAADYERVESTVALGSGSWYRRRVLKSSGLRRGMRVVDIGVGTGLVAREAADIVGDPALVTGVDPSPGMMACAAVPEGVTLVIGTAEHIPLPDSTADFLSMGYALRHINDLTAAYAEFYRVLQPGGLLCVLEITAPKGVVLRALLRGYMRGVVPFVARAVTRSKDTLELMRYFWDTIEACVTPDVVMSGISGAGFTEISRDVELGIFSAYRARKPFCVSND